MVEALPLGNSSTHSRKGLTMSEDPQKVATRVAFAMMDQKDRVERTLLPHIRLQDPEAQHLLGRHFADCNTKGGALDDLLGIANAYHLVSDDGMRGAITWWALQAAAFGVQRDLVSMATYAMALEQENRRLREELCQ